MAELVKDYSYTKPALTELTICLSTPRFEPYRLRANKDEVLAMETYLFNSRLSKALLYPLNVCEIVLRNAANDVLKQDFSQAWYRNPTFTDLLVPKTNKMLSDAVQAVASSNVDDVVAELTFGFWFHLFRSNHHPLWRNRFQRVVRAKPSLDFGDFEPRLRRISAIRNRIAHHEGVLALPQTHSPSAVYEDILFIIESISQDAATWLSSHTTLNKALRTKPRNGVVGPTVGERCDNRFNIVDIADLISALDPTKPSVVMQENEIVGVVGAREIAEFVFSAMDNDTLIAVNEHSVSDLLNTATGVLDFTVLSESVPLNSLHTLISQKRYAVVISQTKAVKGVIAAAHRRY